MPRSYESYRNKRFEDGANAILGIPVLAPTLVVVSAVRIPGGIMTLNPDMVGLGIFGLVFSPFIILTALGGDPTIIDVIKGRC